MAGVVYENHIGTQFRIQETLNSRLSRSGTLRTYKVHHLWGNGNVWTPASEYYEFRSRWWRTAEAGEKYLKEYAEKYHWKRVEAGND